jgi:diguanylate cyclase (GGDEF)-like protein
MDRAARYATMLTGMMIDIDNFKQINDTYGHLVGDRVLKQLSSLLKREQRSVDIVARYGGEEFLAILDGATADQAAAIAEEIRTSFAVVQVIGPDGSPVTATVSAGCAAMGTDEDRYADIVARSDVGLVMAKRAGRNRVIAA